MTNDVLHSIRFCCERNADDWTNFPDIGSISYSETDDKVENAVSVPIDDLVWDGVERLIFTYLWRSL